LTETTQTNNRPLITAFDRTVLIIIGVIVAAIVLTIALGDRVGVTLERVSPVGSARSTSPITIQFSESMNRPTVSERLQFDPPLEGTVTWSANTLIYTPAEPMSPGASYTVTLMRGAQSEGGREVLSDTQFTFEVRRPRVAYLYPADDVPQNLWVVDPANLDSAAQVTFSATGIYDYAVSPDGSQIAFSERNTNGTNDIKLLDLDTGALTQITNCQDSSCTTPVWRPDGRLIAYERVDFNSDLGGVGRSPTRIWLADPFTSPPSSRPLFTQTQILGYNAQWSADGRRIAVFDSASVSILVYDFTTEEILAIPSRAGTSGALSPDGTKLVFPEVPPITEGQSIRQYLRIADLEANTVEFISTPEDPLEDDQARWNPDGTLLAITRRYSDERGTRGHLLYVLDPFNPTDARPVINDPNYADGAFYWSPTGDQLLVQRLRMFDEQGNPDNLARPEIWVTNLDGSAAQMVAHNAYLPRWVP